MDVKLARELYGATPWMVDPITLPSLMNTLRDIRNGVVTIESDEKMNSFGFYDMDSRLALASSEIDASGETKHNYIGLFNFDGPITRAGGRSTHGTKQISANMKRASKRSDVKGIVLMCDSGGGSADAMFAMTKAIQEIRAAGTPVVAVIEDGGLACSAMYGIASACTTVMAETKQVRVGSIGTMISFESFPIGVTETQKGSFAVKAYASESVHKNEYFEKALQGNIEFLRKEFLDPANEKFMAMIAENRPATTEEHRTGKVFTGDEIMGTFVDSIGGLQEAIKFINNFGSAESNNGKTSAASATNETESSHEGEGNINQNNKEMTIDELKSQHPETYAQIFAAGREEGVKAGVAQENDRAGAWLAHANADSEKAIAGVKSGKNISQTESQEFLVLAASSGKGKGYEQESAEAIDTSNADTSADAGPAESEAADFYKNVESKIK